MRVYTNSNSTQVDIKEVNIVLSNGDRFTLREWPGALEVMAQYQSSGHHALSATGHSSNVLHLRRVRV